MSSRKDSAVFVQVLTLLATMFATVFIFRLVGGPFGEHSLNDEAGVVTVLENSEGDILLDETIVLTDGRNSPITFTFKNAYGDSGNPRNSDTNYFILIESGDDYAEDIAEAIQYPFDYAKAQGNLKSTAIWSDGRSNNFPLNDRYARAEGSVSITSSAPTNDIVVEVVRTVAPGWSAKTWLTLFAIMFAQMLSFGFGILMAGTSASRGKSFPFQFTAIGMIFLYDLAVACLFLVALTPISIEWLASFHVISFILLVIGLGAFHIGGGIVEEIEIRDVQQRQPANEHRVQVQELVDMATRLKNTDKIDVHEVFSSLQEELEYATSESLPGSENIDGEIQDHINVLNGLLRSLGSQELGDDVSDSVSSDLVNKVEELKIVVKRRDKLMMNLRS